MVRRFSKRLVIDASVARSAGITEAPTSKYCRDFLQQMRKICHRLVMTNDILQEWKKNESRFSKKWRTEMESRNKEKVVNLENVKNADLRKILENRIIDEREKRIVLKDIHLIEAAINADFIVISRDDEVRKLLKKYSGEIDTLRNILWVNPCEGYGQALEWLNQGAKSDLPRRLDHD